MPENSTPPAGSADSSAAPASGSSAAHGSSATSAVGGIAMDALKGKAAGASTTEAGSAAIKQGAQKLAESGIKKASGSEIAVDALRSAQKAKSGDIVGGAQDFAASGVNAGVTSAVAATGVGAPVATVAGSAAGSITRSKPVRWMIAMVGALVLAVGAAQVGIVALAVVGSFGAVSSILAKESQDDDSEACTEGVSVGTTGDLAGTSIESKAWSYLTGTAGYSPEQAAGIMGNIKRESQFNPFLAENVTSSPVISKGWGLVQWTADRHTSIKNAVLADPALGAKFYVAAPSYTSMPSGLTQDDIDAMTLFQLQYIVKELGSNEAQAGQSLKNSTTVEAATRAFEKDYERAGVSAIDERISAAQGYFDQFTGGSAPPASTTAAPGAGTTAGQTQTPGAPAPAEVKSVAGFPASSIQIAAVITSTITSLGGSEQAALLAITTAIGESSLGSDASSMNTANGDGDQGLYQMRVIERDGAYYGTPQQVMDPAWSTQAWYQGVDTKAGHMKGLLDVKGWEGMFPADAIHKVQGNDPSTNFVYTNNYAKAKEIFAYVSGIDPASLPSGSVSPDSSVCGSTSNAADVPISGDGPVGAAMSLAGKYPYVFGGGNGDGPGTSSMRSEDAGETGFDCSGVTSFAFKQGAGIVLPRTAKAQYAAFHSSVVQASQIQPGDLIFYTYGRLGGSIDHVAIYVGNGQMVEASHSSNRVRLTPARLSGGGFAGIERVTSLVSGDAAASAATATGDAKAA